MPKEPTPQEMCECGHPKDHHVYETDMGVACGNCNCGSFRPKKEIKHTCNEFGGMIDCPVCTPASKKCKRCGLLKSTIEATGKLCVGISTINIPPHDFGDTTVAPKENKKETLMDTKMICRCGHPKSLHLSGGIGVCDQYVSQDGYCSCPSFLAAPSQPSQEPTSQEEKKFCANPECDGDLEITAGGHFHEKEICKLCGFLSDDMTRCCSCRRCHIPREKDSYDRGYQEASEKAGFHFINEVIPAEIESAEKRGAEEMKKRALAMIFTTRASYASNDTPEKAGERMRKNIFEIVKSLPLSDKDNEK